jgi:hypothetical protein
MDLGLKGRSALVTAASKGLGRACAGALIGEGAEVFISSRDAASIESTAKQINAAGWLAADVSRPGDPEALVKAAITRLAGLDVLVINAGGPPPGTFQSTPLELWDVAFQLTLMSAVRLIKAALPYLKRSEQGRIVCITSISVRQPIPNIALSNSMRAAVTGQLPRPRCHPHRPHAGARGGGRRRPGGADQAAVGRRADGSVGRPGGVRGRVRIPLLEAGGLHHRPDARGRRRRAVGCPLRARVSPPGALRAPTSPLRGEAN